MFFFALDNLALAFLYYVFEWKGIAPTGQGVIGGMALAFLFFYVRKNTSPGEVFLVIIKTTLVTFLLGYSFAPVMVNNFLLYLMLGLVIVVGYFVSLAIVLYTSVTTRPRVDMVMGWMAFCATTLNTLPFISYVTQL